VVTIDYLLYSTIYQLIFYFKNVKLLDKKPNQFTNPPNIDKNDIIFGFFFILDRVAKNKTIKPTYIRGFGQL